MPDGYNKFLSRSKRLVINQTVAEKYVDLLDKNDTLAEQSKWEYCRALMIFLEYLNAQGKDIELLTINDIAEYIKNKKYTDNKINSVLPRIAEFIDFCKDNGLAVNIQKQDIIELKISGKEIKAEGKGRIIWPAEITQIRQRLIEKKEIRKLLLIELIYAYGIKEKDLKYFTAERYNFEDGVFACKHGKKESTTIPKYLRKLIKENPKETFEKYTTYMGKQTETFKNQINVAGSISGTPEKLRILDLMETFKRRSSECFMCRDKYPLEPHYFKLEEFGINDAKSYFPICNDCAKKVVERGNHDI